MLSHCCGKRKFAIKSIHSNRTVSGLDYEQIEKTMKRIVKEEQPFERLEISKEDLLRLFGVRHPFCLIERSCSLYFLFSTIRLKFES